MLESLPVGCIGLGSMGAAMASNLITGGAKVVVYNRSRERAKPLEALGATIAATPAEAAACGLVMTMLADDNAVEAVTLGDDGIVAGLPDGGLHVAMSTIGVAFSERLAKTHADAGQRYLAAPVFGRPEAAAAAKLFIVAGGAADDLARAQPAFDLLGQRTFHIGESPSQANLVKLSGNFLITCVIEGLAETLTLGQKAGVDRAQMLDVFTNTIFGAPVYKTYGAMIVEERFAPPGFALPLGLKDNRLILQAGEALEVPLPFASAIRDRFITALASGYGDLDWSAIARVVADQAGVPSVAKR